MQLTERAYAKLNISLDIISKLPDGYHALRMINLSASLFDEIQVNVSEIPAGYGRPDTANTRVRCSLPYVPSDDRNIAAKAARAFYLYTGIKGFCTEININKKIPVGAGMGGGSSDGAAVLRALNALHGTGLSVKTLEEIGMSFGSDVPFCISGGTALTEGRGDVLTPLGDFPDCDIVICKPPFSISTAELFSRVDVSKIRNRPDTDGILTAVSEQSVINIARRMYNVFEDVLKTGAEDIIAIKGRLFDCGALGTVMTGTGSAVFGLFDDPEKAADANNNLGGIYKDVFSVKPMKRIVL